MVDELAEGKVEGGVSGLPRCERRFAVSTISISVDPVLYRYTASRSRYRTLAFILHDYIAYERSPRNLAS